MKIRELCERTGVSKDTIRHYESLGLLTPTYCPAGRRKYRHYDESVVYRLAHIFNGKQVGFSLREIRGGLDQLMDGTMSYVEQREALTEQAKRIDTKIEELLASKRFLNSQMKRIDRHEAHSKQE